jgi:hypothetical protein
MESNPSIARIKLIIWCVWPIVTIELYRVWRWISHDDIGEQTREKPTQLFILENEKFRNKENVITEYTKPFNCERYS